jgi:hypothetical protein
VPLRRARRGGVARALGRECPRDSRGSKYSSRYRRRYAHQQARRCAGARESEGEERDRYRSSEWAENRSAEIGRVHQCQQYHLSLLPSSKTDPLPRKRDPEQPTANIAADLLRPHPTARFNRHKGRSRVPPSSPSLQTHTSTRSDLTEWVSRSAAQLRPRPSLGLRPALSLTLPPSSLLRGSPSAHFQCLAALPQPNPHPTSSSIAISPPLRRDWHLPPVRNPPISSLARRRLLPGSQPIVPVPL